MLDGELAPPMANGEVVFEAPWQGRIFGMARAMADAGVYDWEEFRACLIEEIAGWDRQRQGEYVYYDHFLNALQRLLLSKGLLGAGGLRERIDELARRPHGHDH